MRRDWRGLLQGLLFTLATWTAAPATAGSQTDTDFDGVADRFDACPTACTAGQDFNHDGCADSACGLHEYMEYHFALLPHPILDEDERLRHLLWLARTACEEETAGTAAGTVSALQEVIAAITRQALPQIDETVILSVVSQASLSMSFFLDPSNLDYIAFPSQCPAVPVDRTCDDTSIVWSSHSGEAACRGSWQVQAYHWCADEACECLEEDCASRWRAEGQRETIQVDIGTHQWPNMICNHCPSHCWFDARHPTQAEAEAEALSRCREIAWQDAASRSQVDAVAVEVDVAFVGKMAPTCSPDHWYEFTCDYTLLGECPCLERAVCRAEACGATEPLFSDFNSSTNLTNALLQRSGLFDPANPELEGPGADAGVCTSDEHNSILTSDVDVQTKFDELQSRRLGLQPLPSGNMRDDLQGLLLRYQSYLGVEKWNHLTPAQRDTFLAMPLNPAWCEVSDVDLVDLNTACGHDVNPRMDAWELARCLRVRDAINEQPAGDQRQMLFDYSAACLDQQLLAAELSDDDCGDAYRISVDTMVSEIIGIGDTDDSVGWAGLIGIMEGEETDLDRMERGTYVDVRQNSLWITLSLIHEWYLREKRVVDEEQALAALSERLAGLWDTIQAAVGGDPFVTLDDDGLPTGPLTFNGEQFSAGRAEKGIDSYAEASRYGERAVLRTLFSSSAPMGGDPVLMLTGDALMPLLDRLDASLPFVDLACRFNSCSGGENPEIIAMLKVLASIVDSDDLSHSLIQSRWRIRDSYFRVFEDLLANHQVLQDAFASVHDSTRLEELLPGKIPVSATGLEAVVEGARSRANTFRSTGSSSGDHANRLRVGLNEDGWDRLNVVFENAVERLRRAIDDYEAERIGAIHNLIVERDNPENMTEVFNGIAATWDQWTEAHTDTEVLRKRLQQEEAHFAAYAAEFQRVADNRAEQGDDFLRIYEETFTIAASEAKYEPGNPNHDPKLGVDHEEIAAFKNDQEARWGISGAAGDLLTLQISEDWSPLCAANYGTVPSFVPEPAEFGTPTGPEGYELARTWDWTAEVTEGTTDQTTASPCVMANPEVSLGEGSTIHFGYRSYRAAIHECESIMHPHAMTRRTSAAFTSGMRIQETPYYEQGAAAGALTMVAVDPITRELMDVWTVGRQSAIFLEQDADLYLAVNDLRSDATQVVDSACAQGELTVHVTQSRSSGSSGFGTALVSAMTTVVADVRSRDELVYANAPILPSQLVEVRDSAWQSLKDAVPVDGDDYPEIYEAFFRFWLDMELSRVEMRSRLMELSRRARQTRLALDTLDADLRLTGGSGRHLRHTSRRRARNLSGEKLRRTLDSVFETVEEELFPVFRMRYPVALERAVAAWSTTLGDLAATDFTLPAVDRAGDAHDMLEGILNDHFATARRRTPTSVSRVVVAFPRVTDSCDPAYATCTSSFRSVDATRAAQAWRPIDDPSVDSETWRFGAFTVIPNDLYVGFTQPATLGCYEHIPVIRSMAVVIEAEASFDEESVNDGGHGVKSSVHPNLVVPHATGPLTYSMQNDDWQYLHPDLLFTNNETEVLLTFNDYLSRVYNGEYSKASGLSPFTTYNLELVSSYTKEPFNWPFMDYARAFYLVFLVETQQVGTRLEWVGPHCSP